MKSSIVVCVAFISIVSIVSVHSRISIDKEHKDLFENASKECMIESHASESKLKVIDNIKCIYFNSFLVDDFAEMIADKSATTKEGKCLKSCLMKKFTTMDASGKMSKEGSLILARAITKNDAEQMECVEKILEACVELEVSSDQ